MNLWARMLADLPALGQRTIARAQRVSLPRGCDSPTRMLRLRQALCHAATVRATYAQLAPEVQAALQDLRSRRGGIAPSELVERYGPVRNWCKLAVDLTPRSISEQLMLLGWLLPRPAAPRHPPRFLVPPELRRWLPEPLPAGARACSTAAEADAHETARAERLAGAHSPTGLPTCPAAETLAASVPALRAANALLLACADHPRALTQAGRLRRSELRTLGPRLADVCSDPTDLLDWQLPLLLEEHLLEEHQGVAQLTLAGQRFLALSPEAQQQQLHNAWICSPTPDAWLQRLCINWRGIDWPVLRRRLCAWGQVLPANAPTDPTARYRLLARSLGPLADAQTHGYRAVDRAPWQPKRAAAIADAALRGPLAWLGLVGGQEPGASLPRSIVKIQLSCDQSTRDVPREVSFLPPAPQCPAGCPTTHLECIPELLEQASSGAQVRWQYGAPGEIIVPHAASRAALRLLPYARWVGADAVGTTYQITPATLARAIRQGWGADKLWTLLAELAGPLPEGWSNGLQAMQRVRLVRAEVLLVDVPALLQRVGRVQSVRRHLAEQIAPGIALVRPEQRASLLRALERQGIACSAEGGSAEWPVSLEESCAAGRRSDHARSYRAPQRAASRAQDADLTQGERAALLIACAHYRLHAPVDAPLLPHGQLEERLRAGLPPTLAATVDQALQGLRSQPHAAEASVEPPDGQVILATLHQALARQRPIELTYDTAGQGSPNTRTVRPIALDRRGDIWYLKAYCSARQAERTFRVDRIGALRIA